MPTTSSHPPTKQPFYERWSYPVLCAVVFAVILAASITDATSEHAVPDLLVHLVQREVILPTLFGLAAGFGVRYLILRRKRATN
jgi:hypothetical protein